MRFVKNNNSKTKIEFHYCFIWIPTFFFIRRSISLRSSFSICKMYYDYMHNKFLDQTCRIKEKCVFDYYCKTKLNLNFIQLNFRRIFHFRTILDEHRIILWSIHSHTILYCLQSACTTYLTWHGMQCTSCNVLRVMHFV